MKIDYSLYLVTNNIKDEDKFLKIIEEAILCGVTIVQLREKDISTGKFYNLALKVKEITSKYKIPLIINDRVDIALAIDASGVHLGQSDLPYRIARKLLPDKIIGISVTNKKEAIKASKEGADYLGCGAIFPTETKKDADYVKIKELININNSVDIPVIAIGGINENNTYKLNNTGIKGIAVVSAIMNSENIKLTCEKLLKY